MSRYCFEEFEFDTHSYSLSKGAVAVSLRPKTAKMLALFLANRGEVLSKTEIIASIWERDHVAEYALHQLVSELRKLAKDKVLVRTLPNQGYCWIAQTVLIEDAPKRPILNKMTGLWGYSGATLAACLVLAAAVLTIGDGGRHPTGLPGVRALTQGVIAMEEGDQEAATAWFKFVMAENPEANQARLLLAESLLLQNRVREASAYLVPMLGFAGDAGLKTTDYDRLAAADLMSRIYQRSGHHVQALHFARQSFLHSAAHCTTEYLDSRMRELLSLTGETGSDSPPLHRDESNHSLLAKTSNYQQHCQSLKARPSADEAPMDRSQPALQSHG